MSPILRWQQPLHAVAAMEIMTAIRDIFLVNIEADPSHSLPESETDRSDIPRAGSLLLLESRGEVSFDPIQRFSRPIGNQGRISERPQALPADPGTLSCRICSPRKHGFLQFLPKRPRRTSTVAGQERNCTAPLPPRRDSADSKPPA